MNKIQNEYILRILDDVRDYNLCLCHLLQLEQVSSGFVVSIEVICCFVFGFRSLTHSLFNLFCFLNFVYLQFMVGTETIGLSTIEKEFCVFLMQ